MLFKQLSLAATAAAFLVVPEISEHDDEIVRTLPAFDGPPIAANAAPLILPAMHVDLHCGECQGENAFIGLDFAVEDGTRLTVNGFELYPSADPWTGDLVAAVDAEGSNVEQTLGYGMFIKPEAVDVEQNLSLIEIDLKIVEVGGQFVRGVPQVTVKVIKAPSGEIIIGSMEMEAEAEEHRGDAETDMMHRIQEKVKEIQSKAKDIWKKLKGGCGRHRQNGHGGGRYSTTEKHGSGDSHPYRHDSLHGHHGHHRHHHGWGRLLKNIAANVIIPVLAGITAGVSVAVLAMGVCSLLALVFRARARRCRRAARLSKAAPTEPAAAEEKAGLMEAQDVETQDPPPQYQDEQETK